MIDSIRPLSAKEVQTEDAVSIIILIVKLNAITNDHLVAPAIFLLNDIHWQIPVIMPAPAPVPMIQNKSKNL